jgi:uncharacterized protein YbaR (Trm112 family)
MDKNLLAILVCPACKGSLSYEHSQQELICSFDKLAYPIIDNIPVMLTNSARNITLDLDT